jgi:hypothetical protein
MTEFFRNRKAKKTTKMNRRKVVPMVPVDPAGERARGLLQCVQCLERVLGSDINTLTPAPTEDQLIASLSSLAGHIQSDMRVLETEMEWLNEYLGATQKRLAEMPVSHTVDTYVYGGRVNKELAKTQARLERAERAYALKETSFRCARTLHSMLENECNRFRHLAADFIETITKANSEANAN